MASVPLATLDTRGIISDPQAVMLRLFKYWISTDPSQSNTFNVGSLGEIIRIAAGNPSTLIQLATGSLEGAFRPYFDEVVVNVYVKDTIGGENSLTRYDLTVHVTVRHENKSYELARVIEDAFSSGDPLINKVLKGEVV